MKIDETSSDLYGRIRLIFNDFSKKDKGRETDINNRYI